MVLERNLHPLVNRKRHSICNNKEVRTWSKFLAWSVERVQLKRIAITFGRLPPLMTRKAILERPH